MRGDVKDGGLVVAFGMHRFAVMAEQQAPRDTVATSRRLVADSQDFIRSAKRHVEVATQQLERVRNALQVVWLQRELRRRSRNAS